MGTHPIFESDFDCLTEMQLIHRDLTSAFKLLRDRSSTETNSYFQVDNEKEVLIHQEDDVVHFERNQFQIQEFKDNLEYHLGAISTGLTQFEKYNDRILNRPAFDENIDEDENEEIEGMTETLSNNFLSSQKILNRVKTRQFRNKMEEKIAKNLASRYAEEISSYSTRFRKCQGNFSRRLQKRETRTADLMDLQGDFEIATDDALDANFQRQELALDTEFLDKREKELNKISKSINDLNQLFRDISSFVVEQGTILDQIEYNVDAAATKTEEGLKQLKKADQYQRKDRKMKAILCMAVTVAILLFLLIMKEIIF